MLLAASMGWLDVKFAAKNIIQRSMFGELGDPIMRYINLLLTLTLTLTGLFSASVVIMKQNHCACLRNVHNFTAGARITGIRTTEIFA